MPGPVPEGEAQVREEVLLLRGEEVNQNIKRRVRLAEMPTAT